MPRRPWAPWRTACQRGEGLDACLDAHGEDLGEGCLDDVAGAVVDELGNGAAADGANEEGLVAEDPEQRKAAVEDLAVAADPDSELAGPGTAGATTDGSVEHVYAFVGEGLVDAADDGGGVGAEVEVGLAGGHARQQAGLAQGDGFYLDGARQRGEYDLAGLGHLLGIVGPLGTSFKKG